MLSSFCQNTTVNCLILKVGKFVANYVVRRIIEFSPTAERPFVLGIRIVKSIFMFLFIVRCFRSSNWEFAYADLQGYTHAFSSMIFSSRRTPTQSLSWKQFLTNSIFSTRSRLCIPFRLDLVAFLSASVINCSSPFSGTHRTKQEWQNKVLLAFTPCSCFLSQWKIKKKKSVSSMW